MTSRLYLCLPLLWAVPASAQVSIPATNTPVSESFDTLATSGTSSALPTGWAFAETGSAANTTYTANNGGANTGDTYSYGTGTQSDRAFGTLLSGSLTSTIGAAFVNNTGTAITALQIAYTGEQWRLGTASREDRLDFAYSVDATSLSTGTYIDVNSLDFIAPTTVTPTGALDGNLAANRTTRQFTITGLSIANGQTFWVRWSDFNASGADDGLAVDDFSLVANPAGGGLTLSVADVSLPEGNVPGDVTNFDFVVTLSGPAPVMGVRFDAATSDGTATVANSDYVGIALQDIEISAGQTSTTVTVLVNHDLIGEPNETFTLTLSNFENVTPTDAIAVGTIVNDDPLEIFQIQGSGNSSPVANSNVVSIDNVVTALAPNGFFMQTPSSRDDGNLATSNGIFVFTSTAPTVAVGDRVSVSGTVVEFFDFTQISAPTVTVTGTLPLPPPVALDATWPSPLRTAPACYADPNIEFANFECIEGMRVNLASGIVNGPSQRFASDPFAEPQIVARSTRAFREPGILFPGLSGIAPSIPVFDNNPEIFELDPDKLGLPNRALTGGTTFSAEGVIGYDFGDFEIWPTQLTTVDAQMPRPVPVAQTGNLTIASINVLRLYDPNAANNSATTCNSTATYTELTEAADFDRRIAKLSSYVRNVLRAPDVIAFQEVENLGVLETLAAKLLVDDPTLAYTAHLAEGSDVGGIDVGFLVRAGRINAGFTLTQLGKAELFTFDDPDSCLHDRPPFLLEGVFSQGDRPFAVMVNHLRSLNGIGDCRSGSTERVCRKRLEQALSIAAFVQSAQTAQPTRPLVVLGDFNAFEFSDGHVDVIGIVKGTALLDGAASPNSQLAPTNDVIEPNLINAIDNLPNAERYSFLFDRNVQVLDHALLNTAGANSLIEAAFARGNVDVPEVFERTAANATTYGEDLFPSGFESPNEYRATRISDHDGLWLRLFP